MPAGGLLFANDHKADKTVVMDLRDPLHPHVHAVFSDLNGFSHPHSFMRLPNGNGLASFRSRAIWTMGRIVRKIAAGRG
jgi:hypothetical protein